jgi:hypothetical protein
VSKSEVKGVVYVEDLDVDGNMTIKWILKQQGVRVEIDLTSCV